MKNLTEKSNNNFNLNLSDKERTSYLANLETEKKNDEKIKEVELEKKKVSQFFDNLNSTKRYKLLENLSFKSLYAVKNFEKYFMSEKFCTKHDIKNNSDFITGKLVITMQNGKKFKVEKTANLLNYKEKCLNYVYASTILIASVMKSEILAESQDIIKTNNMNLKFTLSESGIFSVANLSKNSIVIIHNFAKNQKNNANSFAFRTLKNVLYTKIRKGKNATSRVNDIMILLNRSNSIVQL